MSYDENRISDLIDGGLHQQNKEWFEKTLTVGCKIKIGKEYAHEYGFDEGEIIELVEGSFEHENGLYTETVSCPAIWSEEQGDFDSIYHLFGNGFEYFMDNEIV
jgi:hypothetical protein